MNIHYHIKHKHAKALYEDLKFDPNFLQRTPDLRQPALNAFFGSHGIKSNLDPSIKICVSDARRLCNLIKRGIFTWEETKNLFPRDKYDIALAVTALHPDFMTLQEIINLSAPRDWEITDLSDMIRKEIQLISGLQKAFQDLKSINDIQSS